MSPAAAAIPRRIRNPFALKTSQIATRPISEAITADASTPRISACPGPTTAISGRISRLKQQNKAYTPRNAAVPVVLADFTSGESCKTLPKVAFGNAMTALGKADEMLPDVIILDVDMPPGNGLCVCEMLASHLELRSTPVIVLTGSSSHETIRRCHELGVFYVLKCPDVWSRIKPVLLELFEDCLLSRAG